MKLADSASSETDSQLSNPPDTEVVIMNDNLDVVEEPELMDVPCECYYIVLCTDYYGSQLISSLL